MCLSRRSFGAATKRWLPVLSGLFLLAGAHSAAAVETNTKLDGYRGIWFTIGQDNPPWGPKYSGGMATYTAKHRPIAIYAPAVNKTFFVYGGVVDNGTDLLIMASYYDHATCTVPRPTVVLHKVGVNDPHDNGALLIDKDGYLWVFISGRGRARTGWIFKSVQPYSTDEFVRIRGGSGSDYFEITYPQPCYITDGVPEPLFFHMFTRYTAGRELYYAKSIDGVHWSDDSVPPEQGTKIVGFGGHYQNASEWHGKISTFFNYHPGGNVDLRTNLYYLQTTDQGTTWTTIQGTPVNVPLNTVSNPAMVFNYQAIGKNVYVKDTNFDPAGNPMHLFVTSNGWQAGPDNDPRTWNFVRWDGTQWLFTEITTSDHNYDMSNLWAEGNTLRAYIPSHTGPQPYGCGGELVLWMSTDLGATWHEVQDVTHDSLYNHNYVRRPLKAQDPFYAFWGDGNPFKRGECRLYFGDRSGGRVWRLPQYMAGDFARPERVVDFGGAQSTPLWRSRFESAADAPVSDGLEAEQIANAVGGSGEATGAVPLTYVAYGQPGVGSAPTPDAGQFALSFPDNRTLGIDTIVIGDENGLANALTFEGFFRTPQSDLITSPSAIGRRLVTQKRSSGESSSRLAIGLHGGTVTGGDGLLDYEGFDYTDTAMSGLAGGIGWLPDGQGWGDNDGDYSNALSNDATSLNSAAFPFTPVGARMNKTGGGEAVRSFSSPLNLNVEGGVRYLSFLIRKGQVSGTSSEQLELNLTPVGSASRLIHLGIWNDESFYLGTNTTGVVSTTAPAPKTAANAAAANTTYFIVAKIVAHVGSNDEAFMKVYAPSDTVPATEPTTWTLSATLDSTAVLGAVRIETGSNVVNGQLDEIRCGTTYQSVVDPNAPIATGGGPANVLAVYWHSVTGVDHVEFGNTAVLPDTWYHFAVTYDVASLKWYLNGQLQGTIANPDIIAPGPYSIAIGNNRLTGESDRGYYGLLDLVRISNQALTPAQFLLNGGSCQAECGSNSGGTLWCSGFETLPAGSVVDGQTISHACGAVHNENGIGGSAAGETLLSYAGYDQPGVGAAPSTKAGSFAARFGDDRSLAIDTGIASNTDNLANELTIEGFFSSADLASITTPDSIGRRLVTQRRDGVADTRLAIGLHGSGGANVLAVLWRQDTGTMHLELGTTPVVAGTWHHFALVYGLGGLAWYLDGVPQGLVAGAVLDSAGSATIVVGNQRSDGVADRGFYGLLDEVTIMDKALAPEQFLIATPGATDEPCHPGCAYPFADRDADGDVDQLDFSAFQRCFTGDLPITMAADPACLCFDRDGSGTVDANDLDQFTRCFTGPGTPWVHALYPECAP